MKTTIKYQGEYRDSFSNWKWKPWAGGEEFFKSKARCEREFEYDLMELEERPTHYGFRVVKITTKTKREVV